MISKSIGRELKTLPQGGDLRLPIAAAFRICAARLCIGGMSRELSGKKGRRPLSMAGASQMVTPAAPRAELLTEGGHQHEVIAVPLPAPAGAIDAKRQWGGAPDGGAPGEPFTDADSGQ